MKANVYTQNFWFFDGLLGIAFGFWLGRESQIFADSGEYLPEKVLVATLIGLFSYVLAVFAGFLLSKKFQQIPSWIWITVLGAIFFAFSKYVVLYLIENRNIGESEKLMEYILLMIPQRIESFVAISVISMIPLILFFLAIRFVFYFIKQFSVKI